MEKTKTLFDVIGPVILGPSSSHTAGAVRIGFLAGKIYGKKPEKIIFKLYNSFAQTGKGHGTDKGLLGGILGYGAAHSAIKNIFELADKAGIKYYFEFAEDFSKHPNSVDIKLDDEMEISGSSLGGGEVLITDINGYKFNISGDYPTLILIYKDKPGMINEVTNIIRDEDVNIASMSVSRTARGEEASMVICLDSQLNSNTIEKLKKIDEIYLVRNLDVLE